MQCFSNPTHWNIKTAELLLRDEETRNRQEWLAVLEAAKSDGKGEEMEVDVDEIQDGLPVTQEKKVVTEKIKGPQKVIGMWKPRPIGWVPEGWSDDE